MLCVGRMGRMPHCHVDMVAENALQQEKSVASTNLPGSAARLGSEPRVGFSALASLSALVAGVAVILLTPLRGAPLRHAAHLAQLRCSSMQRSSRGGQK